MKRIAGCVLALCISAAAQMWPNPGPGIAPIGGSGSASIVKTITIDHTKVGGSDSTNFPLLISGTYAYLTTAANGGSIQHTVAQPLYSLTVPADLKFATASGCGSGLLKWEFESYAPTTGAVNLWVQVPTLSHATDTILYMCYGDSSVTTWQGGAFGSVWDDNFSAVWHFPDGATLNLADATSNGRNGTGVNAPAATAGEIGGGVGLNGTSQHISTGITTAFGDFTISAWIRPTTNAATYHRIADKSYNTGFWFGHDGATGAGWGGGILETSSPFGTFTAVTDGVWTYLAMSRSGTMKTIWKNGSAAATATVSSALLDGTALYVGGQNPPSAMGYYNGSIDELRLSRTARSADWIMAEYNNQSSPATFYTIAP